MLFLDIPSCVGMHSSPFPPFLLEREGFKSRLYVNSFVFLFVLCFVGCCWMLFVISFLIVLQALHSLRYGEP